MVRTFDLTPGSAREAYAKKGYQVVYINVLQDPEKLEEMLRHSKGKRKVPVIIEENHVTIGFGGS
ncbi:MAG: hypothetical protein KCCBMMGE_00535 [Candidatus Methanoperedenaceae archaeon GB37]|nr:MAG: hypothetical protein KCCBMMGE_00535 [Candidatus Methanoperedenaceae archaeon GB37]